MSRRRANKRKGNADDDEWQEEAKRPKQKPVATAAAASSSSADDTLDSLFSVATANLSPVASAAPSVAAAATSSPAAAAAAASSLPAAASSAAAAAPSAASVADSTSHLRDEPEDVACSACHESFECADESVHLPRTLPCGHLLCAACIRKQLSLTSGRVQCPSNQEHGEQEIHIAPSKSPANGPVAQQSKSQAAASRAEPTIEDCLRQLPPAKELIAAIRNQQSLMTRIGQQGARCSRPGCEASVTHYCSNCPGGDLCSTHERTRHTVFPSHKAHTMLIALKASFLRDQAQSKLAGPAAEIRARADALLNQLQRDAQRLADARKRIEAEAESNAKALAAQQRTVDRMRAADNETVLEMEVERLNSQPGPAAGVRPAIDSAVLNTLSDDRVADLQSLLGFGLITHAKLIYRASRDGFTPQDWWRLCGGESNTLTLVRAKDNAFVFGAFAPFQWPAGVPAKDESIADPTGATCLISLANAHNRAVKLRLKESQKTKAGRIYPTFGPFFGYSDVVLMRGSMPADAVSGNYLSSSGSSFEFDSVADGGKPIAYDKTLLAGDDGKHNDYVYFAAAEIEAWQL